MNIPRDEFGNPIQPMLVLANPQKNKIDILSGVLDLKFKEYFNSINEMTFKVYKEANGKINKNYDKLETGKLIQYPGDFWFQIKEAQETFSNDSIVPYKEVKCLSLENELIYKSITDIDGVFSLYDTSEQNNSLMHIVRKKTRWNIGHIDNELLEKYRTLDISGNKVYNFLTTDIAESFGCIFKFDTASKSISTYELSNVGKLTNIVISDRNVLNSYVKESDLDKIVTKMRVVGGTDTSGMQFDIRAVNYGYDYIFNVDYYMTTEWMSQGLIDALTSYKTKQNNYLTSYTNTLNQLKDYQEELNTLEAQLTDLNGLYNSRVTTYSTFVKDKGVPTSSDVNYTVYQTALTEANNYFTQIKNKEAQIANKKSQIITVNNTINNINNGVDINTHFTTAQLDELEVFLKEGEYEDDTFIANDLMTEAEIIELKLELLENAKKELARVSRPQYTFKTTLNNLFTIMNGKDQKISFDKWREDFEVGNIITLKFRDDYSVQVRLMSLEYDFNNLTDIGVTFSDKSRLDDELIQLAEIIAQAERTSSTLSLSKYAYDNSAGMTNEVRQFLTGTFNATVNKMTSNDNQELLIDEYGLKMRKWLPSQNKYSDYQAWWNNYNLLFTSDGWKSSSTALGMLTGADGLDYFGLATDALIGNWILTSKVSIINANSSIVLNKDGATFKDCDITITKGDNILTLNATDGIKLTKDGNSQFYINSNGDVTFNGLITGGSININNKFKVDSNGNLIAVGGSFCGDISGSSITGSSFISYSSDISYSMTINYGNLKFKNYSNDVELVANVLNVGWNSPVGIPTILFPTYAQIPTLQCQSIQAVGASHISVDSDLQVKGYSVLTTDSVSDIVSGISTNQITASNTGYGNIDFLGFDNAAGVNWVKTHFETKTSSDIRLKYNIQPLDNLPDDLFYSLKPCQFKYKPETNYRKGIFFGLIAQQVESAFESYGLNPYNYDLIEVADVKKYNDDGYYVNDKTHRLNDKNLFAWMIKIIQNQNERITFLENTIK